MFLQRWYLAKISCRVIHWKRAQIGPGLVLRALVDLKKGTLLAVHKLVGEAQWIRSSSALVMFAILAVSSNKNAIVTMTFLPKLRAMNLMAHRIWRRALYPLVLDSGSLLAIMLLPMACHEKSGIVTDNHDLNLMQLVALAIVAHNARW